MSLPLFDDRPSYTDRVLALFTAHPREPIPFTHLNREFGIGGWRTRVSEARHQLRACGRGTIVNHQVRHKDAPTESFYTFMPEGDRR
jgi:hypothetical protein